MEDNEYHDNAFVNDSLQYVSTPINNSIYFWDDWNFLNISDHDDSDTNGSVGAVSATSSPQLTIRLYPPEESPVPTSDVNNYWGLLALVLVFGTAAGNILVCLAIAWERRLQNVTNYFLMSLAITDLMVAVLVMPLGILTLVYGEYLNVLYITLATLSTQGWGQHSRFGTKYKLWC